MLITNQLKNQQHQLKIHKDYLRNVLHNHHIMIDIFLSVIVYTAIKYRKSGRFIKVFINTFILMAPRLFIRNLGKANNFSLVLIQTLFTTGLNFWVNKNRN